jgi:hypothetical protein
MIGRLFLNRLAGSRSEHPREVTWLDVNALKTQTLGNLRSLSFCA